jgi:hypothetical protein
MDKTTRLIKWQRITIVTLFFAVVTLGSAYNRERHLAADLDEVAAETSRRGSWTLNQERDESDRIIRDLHERLRKYEARYGEISPIRKGEGVYIRKLGLKQPESR